MSTEVIITDRLAYQAHKRNRALEEIPLSLSHVQRALLAVTIACAILSLIPTLGTIGSISLRSVAVAAASLHCIAAWKNEGIQGLALQVMRVALVALGLAGVVIKLNILVTAAIAADIFFQALESIRGVYRKDHMKAFSHCAIIVIDTFVLAGMLTESWAFMATAASLSAVVMLAFMSVAIWRRCSHKDWAGGVFDTLCYLALTGIGVASAIQVAEITTLHRTNTFLIENHKAHDVTVYDAHGNVLGTIKSGESASFTLDSNDSFRNNTIKYCETNGMPEYQRPDTYSIDYPVLKLPMCAEDFPILPVDGAAVISEQLQEMAHSRQLAEKKVAAFLAPSKYPIIPCTHNPAKKDNLITFIHKKSGKECSFNFPAICEQSAYFKDADGLDLSRDKVSLDILNSQESLFDQLMLYFAQGDLDGLDKLHEERLIELYTAADYLLIPRLEDLCAGEIAKRLVATTWKNTDLLQPFRKQGRLLSKLVDLYNFSSFC